MNIQNISNILSEIENIKNEIVSFCEKENKKNKSGIICPACGSFNNRIINSRENYDKFRIRRRECLDCSNKWNTEEIISDYGCY